MADAPSLLVVDEHHEALLAWQWARQEGIIAEQGNALLHVDSHDDLFLPRCRPPAPAVSAPLHEWASYVYDYLNIGSFIWPAVYRCLFSSIQCVKPHPAQPSPPPRLHYVRSLDGLGGQLMMGPYLSDPAEVPAGSDIQLVWVRKCSLAAPPPDRQPLVLDIDLDFFDCNEEPAWGPQRIEVTETAYRDFRDNRLHFLRIMPGSQVEALELDGRYFFVFNDIAPIGQSRQSPEQALANVDAFLGWLSHHSVTPSLITVACSRHSGYTPAATAAPLAERLCEGLHNLYGCSNLSLDDLLAPIS